MSDYPPPLSTDLVGDETSPPSTPEPSGFLEGLDAAIALVQQSLDTSRSEDDGESRTIKASIAAREHVVALLTGYRDREARTPEPSGAAEQALIRAANAPSVTEPDRLAVPHFRDTEAIWKAIEPFVRLAPSTPEPSGLQVAKWLHHTSACANRGYGDTCTCGLDAALAAPSTPEPSGDVERLRQQNHDAAVRHDREVAELRSKVARYENAFERARELVRGSPVDWTDDPPSKEPDGWWRYTSLQNRRVIAAAVFDAAPSTPEPSGLREAGYFDGLYAAREAIEEEEAFTQGGAIAQIDGLIDGAAPSTEPVLDVERLAKALRTTGYWTPTGAGEFAASIAAEYARLAESQP